MRRSVWLGLGCVAVGIALLAAACGDSDGTRRVVVNQRVCGNIAFLKLELGRTNRLVLDNTDHSDDQNGMALVLDRFPVDVVGSIPEGSTIGTPYSTIQLNASPGETAEVDLRPTFTGIYPASCRVTVRPNGGSVQIVDYKLDFQLTEG